MSRRGASENDGEHPALPWRPFRDLPDGITSELGVEVHDGLPVETQDRPLRCSNRNHVTTKLGVLADE